MSTLALEHDDHPDNHKDDHVDNEIIECLNLNNPKSFFMFAGAGSGKTRSLVKALEHIKCTVGEAMLLKMQQVAIITYTNAACDEIQRRIDYYPLFSISTIHSFAWDIIKPYINDIRDWLKVELELKIVDVTEKQEKGTRGSQAYLDRIRDLEKMNKRLQFLPFIKQFSYNPNSENTDKDSLNHSEVIKICSDFIRTKPLLQSILVNKYPIFLIDESQDTKAELILALLSVQQSHVKKISMGLFGDTMQRIYLDGLNKLDESIPKDWETPSKVMNHRSQRRIVELINNIRYDIDGKRQEYRKNKNGGYIHLFIAQIGSNSFEIENKVRNKMAVITSDQLWGNINNCKCLTIEHSMAAKRLGFEHFFIPLHAIKSFKTGLLDGTLSGVAFFANYILPIYKAYSVNDNFEIMRIVRNNSAIFNSKRKTNDLSIDDVAQVQDSVNQLLSLWNKSCNPTCQNILECISKNGLFDLPDNLSVIAERTKDNTVIEIEDKLLKENVEDSNEKKIQAWEQALQAPFSEVCKYYDYISGNSSFDTHQGVKGLEFPRVMVVIDDDDARGTTFNYNKLFGISLKTPADKKNEQEGKETTVDRTKRLFYVTCSRAKESLAIVYYTESVEDAKEHIMKSRWFDDCEVSVIS